MGSSLRRRLTLWNLGVLGLALTGFGAAIIGTNSSRLLADIDRDLRERTRPRPMRGPGPERGPGPPWRGPEPENGLGRPGDGPGPGPGFEPPEPPPVFFNRPVFVGPDLKPVDRRFGQTLVDAAAARKALAGVTTLATVTLNGEKLRVLTVPARRDGRIEGALQATRNLREYDLLLESQLRTLLVLLPLALLAAGLGAHFLSNRALLPIARVTQTAAEIGASDLSRRLDVEGDDELAAMTRTFNGMFARLETAFRDLQQLVENQRRFTADASHELRTPLTRLQLATGNGLAEPFDPEAARRSLKTADEAAKSMARLVEELLVLSRVDAGDLQLRLAPIDLREVAAEAADFCPPTQEQTLDLDLPAEAVMVLGDAHHLKRAIVNLLENAYRHTRAADSIRLSVSPTGTIAVADTGEGIAPEHLPHLTERFYRVDSSRNRADGGSGLGLAIVSSIVAAHGGNLTVESQLGRGTKFSMNFPIQTSSK